MSKIVSKKKITKTTTLADALDLPWGEEVLKKHKVPCLQCPFAKYETGHITLAQVAEMYNLDLPAIMQDLNQRTLNAERFHACSVAVFHSALAEVTPAKTGQKFLADV